MQPKFLVGIVGNEVLVRSNESCRDLVDEAKNYMLLPLDRANMQNPRTRQRKPIKCGEVLFAGSQCNVLFNVPYILIFLSLQYVTTSFCCCD